MGTRYITEKYDDLDGTVVPDDELETIRLSIDNDSFMIDLSHEHAEQLRSALTPYLEKAQRAADFKQRVAASVPGKKGNRTAELNRIRDWANKNGFSVSDRGRVPQDIVDAYEARKK